MRKEIVLGSEDEDDLGVSVAAQKAMDTSVLKRSKGAQKTFRTFIQTKVLEKCIDAKKAVEMRAVFLDST